MKSRFLTATSTQYNHMKNRPAIKKMGGLPFTLDEFRFHALKWFGTEDGVMMCRYLRIPIAIDSCSVDHAMPLMRGGAAGLENLEFISRKGNAIKGGLPPEDMLRYLVFRATLHPDSQADLDERLEKAVSNMAARNWDRKKKAKGQANGK